MTCRGHSAVSRGYTLFRQKNIRTKEYIEKQTHVQAGLTFVCLFYVLHLRMLIAQLFFWWKEQMCNILQLVSSSSFLAGTRNLLMVVCMCPRLHCSIHWDEVPGPSQGWRVASIAQFSWVHTLWGREHKNYRLMLLLWLPNSHSWPGPGILWCWLALDLVNIVQFMKIRSLVLARDDASRALVQSELCKVNASRLAR